MDLITGPDLVLPVGICLDEGADFCFICGFVNPEDLGEVFGWPDGEHFALGFELSKAVEMGLAVGSTLFENIDTVGASENVLGHG